MEKNGGTYIQQTYYPTDFSDAVSKKMTEAYMVGVPVETVGTKGEQVIFGKKTQYKDTLGKYLPSIVHVLNTQNPLSDSNYKNHYTPELYFEKYNNTGKILQLKDKNNVPIVYLWSYSGQYPIAEVKNATYEEVKQALSWDDSYINTLSEKTEPSDDDMNKINALRNSLPNAHITTYVYQPLIGLTKITDPRGIITTYEYDVFGRLKMVKDHQGNPVESFQYNYRNK